MVEQRSTNLGSGGLDPKTPLDGVEWPEVWKAGRKVYTQMSFADLSGSQVALDAINIQIEPRVSGAVIGVIEGV